MSLLAQEGNPQSPLTPAEVQSQGATLPALIGDEGALKMILQDTQTAVAWLEQKQWPLAWRECDILYQSPRPLQTWDKSDVPKANVSRFTVAKHVNSLVPTMTSGIFYEKPPFKIRPRPGKGQTAARAWEALFSALLDSIDFEMEVKAGTECQVLNGTVIYKGGWVRQPKTVKKFKRKTAPIRVKLPLSNRDSIVHTEESDELEVQEIDTVENRPLFEYKELGTIFVDPKWRHANQLNKAGWLVEKAFPTFSDIEKLREQEGYDIPPEEELRALLFPRAPVPMSDSNILNAQTFSGNIHHAAPRDETTSVDPMEQVITLLERWDNGRVMVALSTASAAVLIRNQEHLLGRIPYFSANWWNISGAGYGLGVGRLVGSDQRLQMGSLNAAINILSMAANQTYLRSRGANIPTQQITQKLGGIIDVDGKVDDAFKILEPPKVQPEIWKIIQDSQQTSESTSGADETMVQGSLPQRGGSSIGRSGTGAGNLAMASATRLQGPVGHFVDGVMLPFLKMLRDMVCERMPLAEIRAILGERLGPEFELSEEDLDDFLNSDYEMEILAGAHLAAKKAMAQALPYMVTILENPHLVQQLNAMGWAVDVKELFEMFLEMSEWKNNRNVIRPMTPQEKSQFEKMNPGLQKLQEQQGLVEAKHKAKAAEIDQQQEARLAHDLVLTAGDKASAFEERAADYQADRGSSFFGGANA